MTERIAIKHVGSKMTKIAGVAALLLSLAGAVAPAFAQSPIPGVNTDHSDFTGAGGSPDQRIHEDLLYAGRTDVPPQEVHATKWGLCESLYPSFNPRTGTFVGEDGMTYRCE